MSISSEKLRILTEARIGEGKSKYIFGRHWKQLYEVLSEENENLNEEIFMRGLAKCEFKDPEAVGLIALICSPICSPITDRIMGKIMKELYKFTLYAWYSIFIITIIQSLIEWKIVSSIYPMILCSIITSGSFREWSKEWNIHELIYNTLKAIGKI